jgi:hypothetical protein
MWAGHVVHMDRGISRKTCKVEPLGDLNGRIILKCALET